MRRFATAIALTLMGPLVPLFVAPSPVLGAAAATSPPRVCPGASPCATWRPLDTWSHPYSVYATSFRPFASQPGVVAYATWMHSATTDLALYPGYEGPGVTPLSRGPEMVPLNARTRLLATFNSGFYQADHAAGFYVNHTLYFAMVRGLATVVRYSDGTVDVMAWRGGPRPGPNVVMARQNLPLLVDRGRVNPLASNNAAWGLTLHGVAAVWRTALGIDAKGDLTYVAAPAQTSWSLAHILLEMHCVRAMELDINPEWPIFVSYAHPGAQGPSLFVPNPNQIPDRFLYSSTKDFFALYATTRPGEPQPW